MSRITHLAILPKNIDYWDYYILCRLNDTAARALQRMEYWDGTKSGGNITGEQINDQLKAGRRKASQDTSRFVYKTNEELSWELIGSCSERAAPSMMDLLTHKLMYLTWRNNPYNTFDHTKQYEFQDKLVQSHLNRLYAIVQYFLDLGRQSRPILHAIERLTEEGIYIAQMKEDKDGSVTEDPDANILTIDHVGKKLCLMHEQMVIDEREGKKKHAKKYKPLLPRFIRSDLKKDETNGFNALCDKSARYGKFAVSIPTENVGSGTQNNGIENAENPDREGNFASTITVITTSNYNQQLQTEKEESVVANETVSPNIVPNGTPLSLSSQDQIALLTAQVAELTSQLKHLTRQLPTHTTDAQRETEQQQGSLNATNLDTNDAITDSSIRHNSIVDTADHSNGDDGMEDVENVEQQSRTDDAISHIVNEYIEKDVVALTISNEQQGSIQETMPSLPTEKQQQAATTAMLPGLEPTLNDASSVPNGKKAKGSGKGKGRGKKKQDMTDEQSSMKARVKSFCDAFKAIGVEIFEDPDFYVRTPSTKMELYDTIVDLIENKASHESMKLVFMHFWNEKNKDGEYWWRDPSHLTLNALCKNFGTRLASAKFNQKQAEKKQNESSFSDKQSEKITVGNMHLRKFSDNPLTKRLLDSSSTVVALGVN